MTTWTLAAARLAAGSSARPPAWSCAPGWPGSPASRRTSPLEATTGWRFVAEELERAGSAAHLAEPADTRALRGPKRRAKTDRTDAHHLRDLLLRGRCPSPGCHQLTSPT